MYRAAATAVQAGCAAQNLGQPRAGIGAAGENMPVIAVGGCQMVLRRERRDRRHAGSFLAYVEMIVAAEMTVAGQLHDGFLESAYQQHLFQTLPPQCIG